jgi:hypothetical protein
MEISKLSELYKDLSRPDKRQPEKELPYDLPPQEVSLGRFIDAYAEALPFIAGSFPKGNLDLQALSAHLWDRLRYYFPYDNFSTVDIEDNKDIRFINEALRLISKWFYNADWTSCLMQPREQDIRAALPKERKDHFRTTRRADPSVYPNLGRDGMGKNDRPLPDFYNEALKEPDLLAVYDRHGFKFFQGPAALINTLTKMTTSREVLNDESSYRNLMNGTFSYGAGLLKDWGISLPPPKRNPKDVQLDPVSVSFVKSISGATKLPRYLRRNESYKQSLYFMKTALVAAEMIRRSKEGKLTKHTYKESINWATKKLEKTNEARAGMGERPTEFVSFNFAPPQVERVYKNSSQMHFDVNQLPFALVAVDYMRDKHEKERK